MENKKKEESTAHAAEPATGWRIKLGFAMFIASIAWPLLLPVLPLFGISKQSIAPITGALMVVAEVMLIAAAAIAGKDGFAYIKKRVFGLLKSYGPPREVSATRYKIGLVMFTVPLLSAFLSPYLGHYIPGLASHRWVYALALDISLLVSLFVLGGDFWEKLRSLYVHKAVALMPDTTSDEGGRPT